MVDEDKEKKLIDVDKGRKLIDATERAWKYLTPEEYIQIIYIYSSAVNRKIDIYLN